MPSGDPQRRWFPEMISLLRARWRSDLSWTEVVALRDELDAMANDIRARREIRPAVIRCRRCGFVGPSEPSPLSVRAVILAIGRFDIGPPDEVNALEKRWALHRKIDHVDLFGRPEPDAAQASAETDDGPHAGHSA